MGKVVNPSIELSHPPTPPSLDIYADLDYNPISFHMNLFSQPPFSHSVDPSDCIVLCSPILDSTFVVHEDQVVNGFGVEQQTYIVIYDEYVWESKEEPTVKDDLLLSTLHPLFLNIFFCSTIMICLVKIHPQMFLLLIIHKTHQMSFCHYTVERTHLSF